MKAFKRQDFTSGYESNEGHIIASKIDAIHEVMYHTFNLSSDEPFSFSQLNEMTDRDLIDLVWLCYGVTDKK